MTTSLEEHVAREWRCFHCDEVFTTIEAAREHFGPHELADPACQIDAAKFREMETYFARCQAEDSDGERAWHARASDHARALNDEEQKGFDRGLRAQLERISDDKTCPYCARAAIAAVREREGDRAEAMRAKCEAIVWAYADGQDKTVKASAVARAIAALKDNGERK